ncbi:mediator of RNA polymerase II transcription subunit 17-like protein [Trifolium pratense]|uniref:Mediator of RNA polymerase II transcription subunit 17-like protein n=1 Tax=Trifolium pratense TaxID=57577 RepID=A0A2K3MXS1_TRIPR|nr:mediator of RNA polymerase II transcription subunit 17-like protein [Trifolium pratense]
MDEGMELQLSLDKLPIKRLDSIEENGIERFPPDVDYDEKRTSLIRRIDFAWAIEKDEEKKKQKKSSKEPATPWQWQGMVENLQLAHQELSVIIDLINTSSPLPDKSECRSWVEQLVGRFHVGKQIVAAASTISSGNFICLAISLPLPSCNLSVKSYLSKEEKKKKGKK